MIFQVRVSAEPIQLGSELQGFVATRWVDTESDLIAAHTVETRITEEIRASEKMRFLDSTEIRILSVLPAPQAPVALPGQGYTFFPSQVIQEQATTRSRFSLLNLLGRRRRAADNER
ncbi:MAG: hypothetical protein IT290_07300 [Deltaproteobacteria bacterium]|nr:hypothetical protein [Deltaproteobacteria bacterium]